MNNKKKLTRTKCKSAITIKLMSKKTKTKNKSGKNKLHDIPKNVHVNLL